MQPINLTTSAVSLALDMAQRRAEVASHNIAYANVPGARLVRADFHDAVNALQQVADGSRADAATLSHIDLGRLDSFAPGSLSDGVSLDHEVTELALASAHYQALSEAMNRQFGLMNLALSADQS